MPPKVDPTAAAAQLLQNPQFMALFQKAMGDGPIPQDGDGGAREEWLKKLQENLAKQSEEEMKKQLETPVTDEEGQWMMIMPEPGFCIKCTTHNQGTNGSASGKEKVFINIVKHPRLAEPMPMDPSEFSDNPEDPELKDTIRYRIPLSCSSSRADTDKSGNPCRVYDIVVNPLTIQRCGDDPEFRRFVAAISMSWVQQKHEKNLNTDQFTNVNFKCKGKPEVQRIRLHKPGQAGANNANASSTNALNNDIQLPKHAGTATAPIAPASSTNRKMVQEVDPSSAGNGSSSSSISSNNNNNNTFSVSSSVSKKKPAPPSFVVAKLGSYDWSRHQKPTKNPYFHETVPAELCAEIVLESISSVKEVDVRIHTENGKQLELRWIDDVDDDEDCQPFLVVTFDFPVETDPVSAKFSKKSHALTLRFKVSLPDEVELEERRARESKAEREKEEAADAAMKTKEQKAIDERRTKWERMQKEEQDVMAQRKEYVENLQAVQQGAIPPTLKQEIGNMPPDQARLMMMRLESKTRNGDGIDDMLDKMPEDVLFNVCNCIREKLGLEMRKRDESKEDHLSNNNNNNTKVKKPTEVMKEQFEESSGVQNTEYNYAKKAENLFGVKMYNRYVFALDH